MKTRTLLLSAICILSLVSCEKKEEAPKEESKEACSQELNISTKILGEHFPDESIKNVIKVNLIGIELQQYEYEEKFYSSLTDLAKVLNITGSYYIYITEKATEETKNDIRQEFGSHGIKVSYVDAATNAINELLHTIKIGNSSYEYNGQKFFSLEDMVKQLDKKKSYFLHFMTKMLPEMEEKSLKFLQENNVKVISSSSTTNNPGDTGKENARYPDDFIGAPQWVDGISE